MTFTYEIATNDFFTYHFVPTDFAGAESVLKRSISIDCLRSIKEDATEDEVFMVPVDQPLFQVELPVEEEKPVITCLMLHGQADKINIPAFVKDLAANGFEPTYVRAMVRDGHKFHAKFVNFETVEKMNDFIAYMRNGGLVMGSKVAKGDVKLSFKPFTALPLKDPQNKKGLKNVWFNPKFYSSA
jgi:hypothetical protein